MHEFDSFQFVQFVFGVANRTNSYLFLIQLIAIYLCAITPCWSGGVSVFNPSAELALTQTETRYYGRFIKYPQ